MVTNMKWFQHIKYLNVIRFLFYFRIMLNINRHLTETFFVVKTFIDRCFESFENSYKSDEMRQMF
jgi:hypothetical protein